MSNLKYEPSAGVHISEACRQAVSLAVKHDNPVEFDFNGLTMIAYTKDAPSDVESRWHSLSEQRAAEYRASPEYAARKQADQEQLNRRQTEVTHLMNCAEFVCTLDDWMLWASKFAKSADHTGVTFDRARLINLIEKSGFIKNAWCSDDPTIREQLQTDRKAMGEYIMGQVLNCLKIGMPPHPMTISFVEKYQAISAAT